MEATEGKTALMIPFDGVERQHKDDLTAGDGAKHDILRGKGILANRTSSNIFELLRYCGLPVAYIAQASPISFYAFACEMIPLEVVVRGKAYGSKLKRVPGLVEGYQFDQPLVELYLKTKGRRYGHLELPCDDPLLLLEESGKKAFLYRPDKPLTTETLIATIAPEKLLAPWMLTNLESIASISSRAYATLQYAFAVFGYDYVDMKLEFGSTSRNDIVIADDIDSDSGRLMKDGRHMSKQLYRNNGSLEDVLKVYEHAADLTGRFPEIAGQVRAAAAQSGLSFRHDYLVG